MTQQVGFLYHPRVAASLALAREMAAVAEAAGRATWLASAWDEEEVIAQARGCDLLVTLGGDGTILRVARAALAHHTADTSDPCLHSAPILAVDFGTLGFLAELPPEGAIEGLRRVLAGEGWLEERRLLQATLERDGVVVTEQVALNEAVLARGDRPHAIRLTLWVDDAEVGRYHADGMIVATPTGSTAYALGAGGVVLGPDIPAMLVVPVAPHLALVRGLVVPMTSRVTLVASARRSTVVALDGQLHIPYEAGDRLHVTQANAIARFVRVGPRNAFYATLQPKLRRG